MYDIMVEVEFWVQAGGEMDNKRGGIGEKSPTVLGPVDLKLKVVVAIVGGGNWGVEWRCGRGKGYEVVGAR